MKSWDPEMRLNPLLLYHWPFKGDEGHFHMPIWLCRSNFVVAFCFWTSSLCLACLSVLHPLRHLSEACLRYIIVLWKTLHTNIVLKIFSSYFVLKCATKCLKIGNSEIVAILKFLSHLVFKFNAPVVRKDKSGSTWQTNICSFHFCFSSHSAVHPRYWNKGY